MKIRVGINRFGRIGRMVLIIASENKFQNLDIVAINARIDAESLAYLFTYDSAYGKFNGNIEIKDSNMIVNEKMITVLQESDTEKLPWDELGVDIVIESTGKLTKREYAKKHIKAGAKKVIITAPGKDEDITIVRGVNEGKYNDSIHDIISNASCTTNCIAPIAKVIDEAFKIEKGLMTTIHAYTNDHKY